MSLVLISFALLFMSLTSSFTPRPAQAKYTPTFDAYNTKESMILTPIFTPDNALETIAAWIRTAQSTLDIENQYIRQFDETKDWNEDPSPIVQAILDAKSNGATIRIIVRGDSDDDFFADWAITQGIQARYMDELDNHNKYICIDGTTTIVCSINFSENAFINNREAGIVIQNTNVANYWTTIFDADWAIATEPSAYKRVLNSDDDEMLAPANPQAPRFESHTDFPAENFTGTYNVTLFCNPDNSDEVVFKYLESAKESIYVSMYTISRPKFNDTLINLKKDNPALDIRVLISRRRVGGYENVDTKDAAESLVDALIPVWNSTSGLNFYHNKYWIIDGKHTFIYSGNWSPRSLSEEKVEYNKGEVNRDFGVAVADAPDIAQWYTWMFLNDTDAGSAWELPVGVKVTQIANGDVIDGTITIGAQTAGEITDVKYRWDSGNWKTFGTSADGVYSDSFDTTSKSNGIHSFEVRGYLNSQEFTDKATVTINNEDTWKVLITEVLYNPTAPEDEKEFFEISNAHPFDVLIHNWAVGDDKKTLTFPEAANIETGESIIIARDKAGFKSAFGVDADYELDMSLSNTGDYVFFQNAKGEYIDVIAWGVTAPDGSQGIAATAEDGESIQRTDFTKDTDKGSDFVLGEPTPKGEVVTEPSEEETATAVVSIPVEVIILGVIVLTLIGKTKGKRKDN